MSAYADDCNYGVFSARYGNIYTSRQLLQTIQRAYGLFTPQDDAWPAADGRMVDPFRPTIQPNGFSCLAELHADRRQHLAAVRRMVEELDVLVFTLGLTETWYAKADGAVYPICPGVSGGSFDPARHGFINLRVSEVISDLDRNDRPDPSAESDGAVYPDGFAGAAGRNHGGPKRPGFDDLFEVGVCASLPRKWLPPKAASPISHLTKSSPATTLAAAISPRVFVTSRKPALPMSCGCSCGTTSQATRAAALPDAPSGPKANDTARELEEAVAVLCDELLLDTPKESLAHIEAAPAAAALEASPLVGWFVRR